MIATQTAAQREILYDSPWVSWERLPAGNGKAWIQQIKFYDRIIEEAFPVTLLVGDRRNGAIEIAQAASKITI